MTTWPASRRLFCQDRPHTADGARLRRSPPRGERPRGRHRFSTRRRSRTSDPVPDRTRRCGSCRRYRLTWRLLAPGGPARPGITAVGVGGPALRWLYADAATVGCRTSKRRCSKSGREVVRLSPARHDPPSGVDGPERPDLSRHRRSELSAPTIRRPRRRLVRPPHDTEQHSTERACMPLQATVRRRNVLDRSLQFDWVICVICCVSILS